MHYVSVPGHQLSYTFPNLTQNHEYGFSVSASTIVGESVKTKETRSSPSQSCNEMKFYLT